MNNLLVSIIIPTYNRAHLISETLDSVLAQTYSNWECIVVDDGSTDNTSEILSSYVEKDSRFRYYHRPETKQKGPGACRNYGFEKSNGEFVVFLDSDDVLADFSLFRRVEMFNEYPENDGVIATTQFFEGSIKNLGSVFNNDPIINNEENYLALFLNYEFPFTVMSPIWRRNVIEKVKFREELQLLEDVIFHIEILFLEGIKLKRIPLIDNYYRKPASLKLSFSNRGEEMFKSFLFLFYSYNEKISATFLLKQNFARFVKIIYRIAICSQFPSNNKKYICEIVSKSNYIKPKEQLLFITLSFIYKLHLNNTKYIGMYRIIKYINKKLIL